MEKFKEWLDIVTKISTIGGLIIAILAYYYTIKPIFDEKKLKSEITKLEKEKITLSNEILNFTKKLKLKKEKIETLSNKLDTLENENIKVEWKLFLNTFNERNFNPDILKFDFVYSILSNGTLDLSLIEDTKEEQELYNDKYPLMEIKSSLNKFNYSDDLGITENHFNEFKKVLNELINLNEGHLTFKTKFPINIKQEINEEIMLLKRKKDISINKLKYISDKRQNYKKLLNERKIISTMAINDFLIKSLTTLDKIKTIKQ